MQGLTLDGGLCLLQNPVLSQSEAESIQISVCSVRLQAHFLFTFIFSSVLPALWISNSSNSCNSFVENILLDTDDFYNCIKSNSCHTSSSLSLSSPTGTASDYRSGIQEINISSQVQQDHVNCPSLFKSFLRTLLIYAFSWPENLKR